MKRYITSLIALAAVLSAGAQNLNPTVEVTNQYEGKVMEVAKPVVEMEVPDSLLRFDLEFDYSVFDTPYKGSYDFSPYLMDIRPESDAWRGQQLYVRAGAGYPLLPTFDAVFSPRMNGPFSVNIYANHYSHIGQYNVKLEDYKHKFDGYQMKTRAGFDSRYEFDGGDVTFGAGYYGIHTRESDTPVDGSEEKMGFNALEANVQLRSLRGDESYFFYDARADFKTGAQKFSSMDKLKINEFEFNGLLGPVLDEHSAILFGLHAGITSYKGAFLSQTGSMYIAPKYVWHDDRVRLSAGLRLGQTFHAKNEWMGYVLGPSKSRKIYPDVQVGYEAITDRLNIYANLTGGDHLWHYTELKEDNLFYSPVFGRERAPMVDNTVDRIRVKLGFQGNIRSVFRFDVGGGFAKIENGLLDAVRNVWTPLNLTKNPSGLAYLPAVAFADYDLWFVEGDLVYDGRPVSAEATVHFLGADFKEDSFGFAPASTGLLKVQYNWRDRIKVGAYAEGGLKRKGLVNRISLDGPFYTTDDLTEPVTPGYVVVNGEQAVPLALPGWVDLGLQAELSVTRQLGIWARVGNLLNQNIQRHPVYPSPGVNMTAGIVLNL